MSEAKLPRRRNIKPSPSKPIPLTLLLPAANSLQNINRHLFFPLINNFVINDVLWKCNYFLGGILSFLGGWALELGCGRETLLGGTRGPSMSGIALWVRPRPISSTPYEWPTTLQRSHQHPYPKPKNLKQNHKTPSLRALRCVALRVASRCITPLLRGGGIMQRGGARVLQQVCNKYATLCNNATQGYTQVPVATL